MYHPDNTRQSGKTHKRSRKKKKKKLTPEEEEKRRVRRERNKLAAAKCRNRRRELTEMLQGVSTFHRGLTGSVVELWQDRQC